MVIYNYVGDICGILLTMLVGLVHFFNKSDRKNKTKYLEKLMSCNMILCISSVITALLNNIGINNEILLFANYIYIFVCIEILIYVLLYVAGLIPAYLKDFDKREKKIKRVYRLSELFLTVLMVIMYAWNIDIARIIAYCKFWSYFNIGGTILICSLILYVIDSKRIQNKVKQSTLIIFPFLFVGAIFQFTHTNIKFSGFLYSMLIFFFYLFYHGKQIDVVSGGYLNNSFREDFKKLIRANKEFYVITVQLTNYDFLKRYISRHQINNQIANAIRLMENENSKIKSFREDADKVSFLIEKEHTKGIMDGVSKMVHLFTNQHSTFEEFYDALHFKVFVAECPTVLDDFTNFTKVRSNVYDKCDINQIYMITEDDVKSIVDEHNLIEIFNDIFTKNNPLDERVQVVYQPIFDVDSNKFKTMEALTRLKIDGKLIFPDNFIYILENNGMIHKYSLLVLEKICIFLNKLEKEKIEIDGISINFSSEEFKMKSFEENILSIVNKYGINPNLIRIELTESSDDATQKILEEKMNSMRKLGFKFYLDDFGSGYSNITKLASLKFDTIKIDKSIVWDSLDNNDIRQLLVDLTTFIKAMDMDVLFEGVENEEMSKLTDNVKYLQGYLYSKPIAEEETLMFLKEKNCAV